MAPVFGVVERFGGGKADAHYSASIAHRQPAILEEEKKGKAESVSKNKTITKRGFEWLALIKIWSCSGGGNNNNSGFNGGHYFGKSLLGAVVLHDADVVRVK